MELRSGEIEEGDLTWGLRLRRLMVVGSVQSGSLKEEAFRLVLAKKEAGGEAHWFTHILQFIRGRLPMKLTETKLQCPSLGKDP